MVPEHALAAPMTWTFFICFRFVLDPEEPEWYRIRLTLLEQHSSHVQSLPNHLFSGLTTHLAKKQTRTIVMVVI
jgi:hypothetical protein